MLEVGLAMETIMRKFILALALLTSLCSPAFAGPKEDALLVVQKWTKAFTDSDVDGIVKLYAPDALFFGTRSTTLITGTDGIRKYFENVLLNNRPWTATAGDHSAIVLSDSTVVVTGLDILTNPTGTLKGRFSFVLAKREPGWQIVHFHRSPM